MDRHLIILSCSSVKLKSPELLPAIRRYDGPFFRVINSFLRDNLWPSNLSVGILSAKYGLIGGITPIEFYDQRMDKLRATALKDIATKTLVDWSISHDKISLILGEDYLPALDLTTNSTTQSRIYVVPGPIGIKLNYLHQRLRETNAKPKPQAPVRQNNHPLYFLPDWDDMLDVDFDFQLDNFSNIDKSKRNEQHCVQFMQPKRICDGVVVSLAQHQGTKGVLRKQSPTDINSLAPLSIRRKYSLDASQWAFGDCGGFSYVNEELPSISTEQALSLYQLYDFDLGASVDHIPVPEIVTPKGKITLSEYAKRKRVQLTKRNAADFINLHKERRYSFIPVGVIQGLSPKNYATQIPEYIEMGYTHLAIGGLVPRSDNDIVSIVKEIDKERNKLPRKLKESLWVHLFGIFRPKIQSIIRELHIASFDSATYFRKAWLRSDQNYLGADGKWYAAIRVPLTSDSRTLERLTASGTSLTELERLEARALNALHEYSHRQCSLDDALQSVTQFDSLLDRSYDGNHPLIDSYKRTLESRIWEKCDCPACTQIGIDIIIFRGYNRNKRRGAHNTLALYNKLGND